MPEIYLFLQGQLMKNMDREFYDFMRRFVTEPQSISANLTSFRKQKPDVPGGLQRTHQRSTDDDQTNLCQVLNRVEMTDLAVERLQQCIDSHPQNKFGKHQYSLEKYGLSFEDVKSELKPYEDYMKSIGFNDVI